MHFVIRADASVQIGAGHIMRCLTLADKLSYLGGSVEFITRRLSGNMDDYIQSKGYKVHSLIHSGLLDLPTSDIDSNSMFDYPQELDASETIQLLSGKDTHWLIVDNYCLDIIWEEKLKNYSKKLMVIDDLANRSHCCDLLLDQNYTRNKNRYDNLLFPETIKLLGPKYALLRDSFGGNGVRKKRKFNTIENVFVFFGGADPNDLTSLSLRSLRHPELKNISVTVVIGNINPNQKKIRKLIAQLPNAKLHVQTEDIAELMANADVALGAGGTSTSERLAMGLPSIVVTVADNQVDSIKDLDHDGYLVWIGSADNVCEEIIQVSLLAVIRSPSLGKTQSLSAQKLVSPNGCELVAKLIVEGLDAETLIIRKANPDDCLLYWHWASDPVVRKNAFNIENISWESHQVWFAKQLDNSDAILFLIESEYGPVGQVRFKNVDSVFMISYSIGRVFRGFGLGRGLLEKAISTLRLSYTGIVFGDVKNTNIASKIIFKQLGFKEIVPSPKKGAHRFELHL
ncbi:hypothetical protein MNBD_GAMMA12-1328 [hydrothermal vent metagenome]|uniref:N-acetyltransferase domain-containing protein n=1 Tax=hydrothermal vent metagenome TaxID=652676 RepID=A0A3B0Y4N2_9ZZZZ